jgi:hypothetical protein
LSKLKSTALVWVETVSRDEPSREFIRRNRPHFRNEVGYVQRLASRLDHLDVFCRAAQDTSKTLGLAEMSAKYIYLVALLLYAISLTMPAFVIHADGPLDEVRYGYEILFLGWLGLFIGQMAWYANLLLPAILLAIHFRRPQAAAVLTAIAIAVGLQALLVDRLPRNEAGVNDLVVDHLGSGFYLWEFSFMLIFAYCFTMIGASRRSSQK